MRCPGEKCIMDLDPDDFKGTLAMGPLLPKEEFVVFKKLDFESITSGMGLI